MKNKLTIILAIIFTFPSWSLSLAQEQKSAPVKYIQEIGDAKSIAELKMAFNNLCDSVNKGEIEKAVGFYDKDAVLFSAFSSKIYNTPEARKEYFQMAVKKKFNIKTTDAYIKFFGKFATYNGFSVVTYQDDSGKQISSPLRYSVVYYRMPHGWVIANQHTSRIPQ